jgi:hypothetical protein
MILCRNKHCWCTTFDSEWKMSSPIVDMSSRWTTSRVRTLFADRSLTVKWKRTRIAHAAVATMTVMAVLRGSPRNGRTKAEMLFEWILLYIWHWKWFNGGKTGILSPALRDEARLDTARYIRWLNRERLFYCPFVVSNYDPCEFYCFLFVAGVRTR